MRLLVLVPTRSRPGHAADLLRSWAETDATADLRFVVDHDDPCLEQYRQVVPDGQLTIGPRERLGPTLNRETCYWQDEYDAIGFMGDDHRPRTLGWDQAVCDALWSASLVYGNDLHQGANLPTAVFARADTLREIGYFSPPGLVHMYLDNFWLLLGRYVGITYLDDVVIEHVHPAAGKADADALHAETNSADQYAADAQAWVAYVRDHWPTDRLALTPRIGVAITTRNRPDMYERTVKLWRDRLPPNAVLAVVDDASDVPAELDLADRGWRFDTHVGIAVAKNKCLELLADCPHLFLADDDTWPTVDDWWQPYVGSPEPHLMYQPTELPSHWKITRTAGDTKHVAFDRPRGCMIYLDSELLPVVGGMSTAFGKHGAEHGNWSDRIHTAGFTTWPYADVTDTVMHCADEDEAGLSSIDFAEHQGWKHVDARRIPLFCEYREQPIPVLVPRRGDNGHRDRLWRHTRALWETAGYRIVEGHHASGPFNRSAALNQAAREAGNWHVAIIADSDAYIDPARIREAVDLATATGRLVSPFTEVHELTAQATEHVLRYGVAHALPTDRIRTAPVETQSLILAVPRNLWEQVRGFDEQFKGWGGEDNAFWAACTIAGGEPIRLDGPAWHLWHEPSSRAHQQANIRRLRAYRQADTVRDIHQITAR